MHITNLSDFSSELYKAIGIETLKTIDCSQTNHWFEQRSTFIIKSTIKDCELEKTSLNSTYEQSFWFKKKLKFQPRMSFDYFFEITVEVQQRRQASERSSIFGTKPKKPFVYKGSFTKHCSKWFLHRAKKNRVPLTRLRISWKDIVFKANSIFQLIYH